MIDIYGKKLGDGEPRLSICLAATEDMLDDVDKLARYLVEIDCTDIEVLVAVVKGEGCQEARQKVFTATCAKAPKLAFTNVGVYPPLSLIENTIRELDNDPNCLVEALRLDGTKDGGVYPNPHALGDWQAVTQQTYVKVGGYDKFLMQAAGIDGGFVCRCVTQGCSVVIMDDRVYHSWHESRFPEEIYQYLSQRNFERQRLQGLGEIRFRYPDSMVIVQNGEEVQLPVRRQMDSIQDELPREPKDAEYKAVLQFDRRRRSVPVEDIKVQVLTRHPVAVASPDHIAPDGAIKESYVSPALVQELMWLTNKSPMRVLDIGCGNGLMVNEFLLQGHLAVGIDGTDVPLKEGLATWPTYGGTRLFTADITKPFWVLEDERVMRFDVVMAWDVLEHIAESDIDAVLTSISDALVPGGIFAATIASNSSAENGIEKHQTMQPMEWWIERISQFLSLSDITLHNHQPASPCVVFRRPV